YIALGHIHLFSDLTQVRVSANYAGTPAPLHLGNDNGGTVALVTLDPEAGVQISPRSIALK
ncbi:MAG: exonuclease sbcCD subunit D, partial [Deltaproteobacteria bacterium]|nr:exonuclease sbcCD subunit D [Deltaproteobacteria bacterium]